MVNSPLTIVHRDYCGRLSTVDCGHKYKKNGNFKT